MKLTIPASPPSLNKLLRMHWAARKRLNDSWILLVRTALNGYYLKPLVPMHCKITLGHSRLFDKDNAYGAVKPIVDALKHWKLIYDDSPEYLELEVCQLRTSRKVAGTIIELEVSESGERRF